MQRVSAGALDSRTHGFAPDESTGETAVLVSRSAAQHDARRLTDRARFREGRLHRWRARHGSRLTGAPPHKRRRATGEGDSMRLHDGQFAGRTLHDPKPRLQHRRKRVDDVPRFAELHRERTVGIVNGHQLRFDPSAGCWNLDGHIRLPKRAVENRRRCPWPSSVCFRNDPGPCLARR
jgi:hypothetical protein